MNPVSSLFESIHTFLDNEDKIRERRYGMILVSNGQLQTLQFRPWPKLVSAPEVKWLGGWQHGRQAKDQCRLYYNQPLGHSNFLALKYTVTSFGTSYKTVRRALLILDEIARIKKTDAIVAEITNDRITDRSMKRMGWEEHLPDAKNRHFIRRFYGDYPTPLYSNSSESMFIDS